MAACKRLVHLFALLASLHHGGPHPHAAPVDVALLLRAAAHRRTVTL